ncbi:MAG: 5-methyltetrahydrofolate--homocysteine methyltransferase [Cellvibrionaceae bacterium]|jgi:5-methyltetrahydrofolate--homocysteine methyltransferase
MSFETIIESRTKIVKIGPDHPFCVIGERINPTGRKLLAREMSMGDYSRVERDALEQVAKGATVLDINAGIPLTDEPQILADTIRLVQSIVDVPLCIDSSIVEALEKGLAAYIGKAILNSVTGEDEQMERVLPLVKKYGCAVIGISNDETGISEDPDVRYAVAKKIVERAADYGIPKSDILIDPLVMPIGALRYAGRQVFSLVRRLTEELKVNTSCGASNISFGLPQRNPLNAHALTMFMASGMTSAITNPNHHEIMDGIMAGNVMTGNDENCFKWIKEMAPRDNAIKAARAAARAEARGEAPPEVVEAGRDRKRRRRKE